MEVAPSPRTLAYAKLIGDHDLVFYLKTPSMTLGRATAEPDPSLPTFLPLSALPDLDLGPNKSISRLHARIAFNNSARAFELACLSPNGLFVDGMFVEPSATPVILRSRSLIQIADRMMFFLLPSSVVRRPSFPALSLPVKQISPEFAHLMQGLKSKPPAWVFSPDDMTNPACLALNLDAILSNEALAPSIPWKRGGREKFKNSFLQWGFGRWEKIVEDIGEPDITIKELQLFALSFLRKIYLLVMEDNDDLLKVAMQDMIERIAHSEYTPTKLVDDPSFDDWAGLKKSAKKFGSRIVMLFILKTSIDRYGEAHIFDGLDLPPGKSISASWGPREDHDLLVGLYRYGYGSFVQIMADRSFCFCERFHDEKYDVPGKEKWPPQLALLGRIKKLLDLMKMRDDYLEQAFNKQVPKRKPGAFMDEGSAKKQKTGEVEASEPVDISTLKVWDEINNLHIPAKVGKVKTSVKTGTWTKKDIAYFQKAVLSMARPLSWDHFRAAWPQLEGRSDAILEKMFQKTVSAMNKLVGSDVVSEPTEPIAHDDSVEVPDPDLKARTATILKERFDLMHSVREKVLKRPDFESKVISVPEPKDFPTWWSPRCDRSLIIATLKHGYGNWEATLIDPDMEFCKLSIEKDDLPDHKTIVRRLKQIVSFFGAGKKKKKKPSETYKSSDVTKNGSSLKAEPSSVSADVEMDQGSDVMESDSSELESDDDAI